MSQIPQEDVLIAELAFVSLKLKMWIGMVPDMEVYPRHLWRQGMRIVLRRILPFVLNVTNLLSFFKDEKRDGVSLLRSGLYIL